MDNQENRGQFSFCLVQLLFAKITENKTCRESTVITLKIVWTVKKYILTNISKSNILNKNEI